MSTQPIVVDPSLVQSISVDPSEVSAVGAQSASASQPSVGEKLTRGYNPDVEAFAEKHPILGVPARYLDSAGGAAMNFLPSIYHAFSDPLTPEEEANFKGHSRIPGEVVLERLTGAEAGVRAGQDYASGKVSPKAALSALPEALGTGTGTAAVGAGVSELAGQAAPAIKAVIERARNVTPKQAAQAMGATSGAISGHGALSAPGAYYGAKTAGAITEGVLGKERANAPILPRKPTVTLSEAEEFEGVPSPQTEHASSLEPEAAPAETKSAEPETKAPVTETPAQTLTKKASPAEIEKALNDALGGKPLQKGVALKNQNQPAAAAAKLPQDFTPVDSSLLKGYKYDPEAQEFTAILKNGQTYTHGEVTPEQVKDFENADSQGSAWTKKIKQGAGTVLVQKNGESVVPSTMQSASGEVIPKAAAGMQDMDPALSQKLANLKDFINTAPAKALAKPAASVNTPAAAPEADLTSLLQQSLDQTKAKGGVFTSAEPSALTARWGVDENSIADTDANVRGKSPAQTKAYVTKLAKAYKNGQAVEPVMETRDADNNVIEVDGRHRALAAQQAGIERIPIIVRRLGTGTVQ
jgi:hypothetical protein